MRTRKEEVTMGDRCYVELIFKKGDLLRATEAVNEFWRKKYSSYSNESGWAITINGKWYDEIEDHEDGTVKLIICEANYGMSDELQALAEAKIDFVYFHGAGGTYGPCVGVCIDGELLECSADVDGNPVVAITGDCGVPWEEVEKCWKYHSMVKKLYDEE